MAEHMIIPDTQCRPGLTYEHLTAAGNYIVDKQPDTIIHLGDHWDMKSLSSYDRGTKKAEGDRYQADIDAGLEGMDALLAPLREFNKGKRKNRYKPRMIFLLGNHEERIMRHINANAELEGKLGYADLQLEEYGWEVYDFLEMVNVDGVTYSHFFANPNTGRPWGGMARTRLNNIGFSFTMGHQQGKELGEKPLANGKVLRACIVGSFYQHDEAYKGHQGNNHYRGCIYKHEVKDGNYNIMELSMDYLLRKWS